MVAAIVRHLDPVVATAEAFNLGRSEIVTQLNANGVPCRGQRWHLTTVARVLRTGAVG